VMVAAGSPNQQTIDRLAGVLEVCAMAVDRGNSRYTDSLDGVEISASRGIGPCDVWVSGGR
jgi:6-phosphogluconate dehydrogenase (decarboxylating)